MSRTTAPPAQGLGRRRYSMLVRMTFDAPKFGHVWLRAAGRRFLVPLNRPGLSTIIGDAPVDAGTPRAAMRRKGLSDGNWNPSTTAPGPQAKKRRPSRLLHATIACGKGRSFVNVKVVAWPTPRSSTLRAEVIPHHHP